MRPGRCIVTTALPNRLQVKKEQRLSFRRWDKLKVSNITFGNTRYACGLRNFPYVIISLRNRHLAILRGDDMCVDAAHAKRAAAS